MRGRQPPAAEPRRRLEVELGLRPGEGESRRQRISACRRIQPLEAGVEEADERVVVVVTSVHCIFCIQHLDEGGPVVHASSVRLGVA